MGNDGLSWPAVRSIHLQGGCRSNDVENMLQLEPVASNGEIASFQTPGYAAAYGLLSKAGFQIIGVDFYTEVEQADGRRLPSWRAYRHIGSTNWPCAEQADTWSFLAHSAIREKNGLLWDVASRISHQLRTCDWRLRQVSECYRDQLSATVRTQRFLDGRRFYDGFTWLGYLAIQAFLVDACVLRDYLAEYRGLILTQAGQHTFRRKITRISSLKTYYLDKVTLSVPVDQVLGKATEPGGWLYLLGTYRDLVVHSAPLARAGRDLYAVCKALPLDAAKTLPSIKLPIPPDPESIAKSRSSGAYWEDPEQNFARFRNALENPDVALDGLQYAHAALGHLSLLAIQLAAISPVKPEMPALTDKDIIQIEIVKGGNDDETGRRSAER